MRDDVFRWLGANLEVALIYMFAIFNPLSVSMVTYLVSKYQAISAFSETGSNTFYEKQS